jgi:hypothetical protein
VYTVHRFGILDLKVCFSLELGEISIIYHECVSLLQELCKESLINGIDIGPVFHFDKKVFKIVNRNE